MVYDRDRENQLSGCAARVQQGRKNINGSGVVITVALKWGNFFGALTSLGLLAKEVRVEWCTYQPYAPWGRYLEAPKADALGGKICA